MHSLRDQVERGGGDLLLDEATVVKEEVRVCEERRVRWILT